MANQTPNAMHENHQNSNQPMNFMPSVRAASEKKMGLLHFISPANHGWHGDVRKRFTDFMVNEIRKDGKVLHLEDYKLGERPTDTDIHIPGQHNNQHKPAPAAGGDAPTSRPIAEEDVAALQKLVGEDTTIALIALYDRTVASGNIPLDPKANLIKLPPMERSDRGRVHQEIRRIFASKIETETDNDGIITAVPSKPRSGRNPRAGGPRGRTNQLSFKKLGGEYLHFTLYKENKDTMDAVNQIGRMLKIKSNFFGFAGTKDRRAATVQRMSVSRVRHQTLDFLNSQIPAIKMGDYKYSQHPIQLGDHGGNEFRITVKNVELSRSEACSLERRVQLTKQAVEVAVSGLTKYGFINYYGLQRFGTHVVGTHELGKMILMENYEGVIDGLLYVDEDFMARVISGSVQETPSNRDEINRVRAIVQFKTTKNAKAAIQLMPKRFGSETSVILQLDKNPRDFQGAILTITRGMRNLYLHAYQSYVWNHAASYRWAKYGSKVMPGDLVLVTSENSTGGGLDEEDEYQRARALSEEEAESGKYSIFDVVLPGPGFDVIYPNNDIGEFYVEFMKKPENGSLDPHRMRRSTKDFSLSGTYRHVLGRFKGEPKWEVRTYVDDSEQMRPTDVDLIEQRKAAATANVEADATTSTERRRQQENPEAEPRVNDVWAQTSEDGSSKRIKFKQDDSPLDTPGDHGVSQGIQTTRHNGNFASGASNEVVKTQPLTKPIRQPTVPDPGSAGFVRSTNPEVSKPAVDASTSSTLNEALASETLGKHLRDSEAPGATAETASAQADDKTVLKTTNRVGNQTIHSFTQPDLTGVKDEDIKIAVVLEFSLNQSAYATVVLRELMAEVEPEKPGSPLYPQ